MSTSVPLPGSTVTLTTSYKSWVEGVGTEVTTRTGRVLPRQSWFRPDDFAFFDTQYRVINISNVTSMEVLEGETAVIPNAPSVTIVTGSKGATYAVTVQNGVTSCTCPSYSFRRTCKHINNIHQQKESVPMSITLLKNRGFNTESYTRAVQEFNERKLSLKATNNLIKELAPAASPIDNLELAHYTAGYLIQRSVKEKQATSFEGLEAFTAALEAAKELRERGYNSSVYEAEQAGVTATSESEVARRVRRSGGSKLESAKQFLSAPENATIGRKAAIEAMVGMGIGKATAATYYSTLRKGEGKSERTRGPKTNGREAQVRQLFQTRDAWGSRAEFVNACVSDLGMSKASATTYSYKVMESTPGQRARAPKAKSGAASQRAQILADLYASKTWESRSEFVNAIIEKLDCSKPAAMTASYSVMPSSRGQ